HETAPLGEAFAQVLERGGESGLQDLLQEIVAKRDGLRQSIDALSDGHSILSALRAEFGFDADETAAAFASRAWPLPGVSPAQFSEFVLAVEEVSAANLRKWMVEGACGAFEETDPVLRLILLQQAFFTGKGE